MSQLEVNKVLPQSGTTLTLGESGDTITIPSGATLDASSGTLTLPDGTVTNAKVNASAAIAYSKLNLATSIVNADISTTAAIATTKLGAGAVLQVVQTTSASSLTTTSATFVTLNLAATITPSSASSKILMLFTTNAQNTTGANGCIITLYRGSIATGTNLGDSSWGFGNFDSGVIIAPFAITHLDSPNTTSAITYTPAGRANSGTNLVTSFGGSRGSFILMEIAG
jgi:hypothetical protein